MDPAPRVVLWTATHRVPRKRGIPCAIVSKGYVTRLYDTSLPALTAGYYTTHPRRTRRGHLGSQHPPLTGLDTWTCAQAVYGPGYVVASMSSARAAFATIRAFDCSSVASAGGIVRGERLWRLTDRTPGWSWERVARPLQARLRGVARLSRPGEYKGARSIE